MKKIIHADWVEIVDGNDKSKFILIGGLNDSEFLEKLRDFVYEVCKIKKGAECLNNQNFFDYLSEKGYLFDKNLIENYLLALKVKPFMILTGNSGTGKTKLAQLFAQYLNKNRKFSTKEVYENKYSINRSVTSYSRKHYGGWRLKPDEIIELLNNFKVNSLSKLPENIIIEITHNGQSFRGKAYFKEMKRSYSDDMQVYLYYDKDSPLQNGFDIIKDEIKINLIIKEQEIIYNKKYEIVPVGANWTENRHIVGFYNVITGKYQTTQALDLILKASNETKDLRSSNRSIFP